MLEAQQMSAKVRLGHLQESGHFGHGHRRVQPQVAPDGRQRQLLLHLVHEDLGQLLERFASVIGRRSFDRWGNRRQKFRRSECKRIFEFLKKQ